MESRLLRRYWIVWGVLAFAIVGQPALLFLLAAAVALPRPLSRVRGS
jgi:hypothetical protein